MLAEEIPLVGGIDYDCVVGQSGLVEKGEKDRRTNVYTTTRRGRRELEDRREWENQYVEAIDAITA